MIPSLLLLLPLAVPPAPLDVSSLAGRPLRIRIELRRAKLYAFRFTRE